MARHQLVIRRRLEIQSLESRRLMAGDVPTFGGGILNVQAETTVEFSSRHSGGVNFCMGDGSVRSIRSSDTMGGQLVDAVMTDDPFFFDGVGN